MDAVESNHSMLELKAEIAKTTEVIDKLSQAAESITQRMNIIKIEKEGIGGMYKEIDNNKHRRIKEWIRDLRDEIVHLEQFPYSPFCDPTVAETPFSNAKELDEQVQKLKIKFHHNSKNLTTERRLAREIQRSESERQKQTVVEVEFEEENYIHRNPCRHVRRHFRGSRPLPNNMPTKSSIRIWAEKVEYVSSLVLRDSKNLKTTWQTIGNLEDLRATRIQVYWQMKIGRDEFRKHWDSMKRTKKSIENVEFDLIKASRRHQEGYAETERLRKKIGEIERKSCYPMVLELKKISKEQSIAHKYLLKLERELNGVTG